MALAECALLGGTGATLDVAQPDRFGDLHAAEIMLFSEDQGRAVVTCPAEDVPDSFDTRRLRPEDPGQLGDSPASSGPLDGGRAGDRPAVRHRWDDDRRIEHRER